MILRWTKGTLMLVSLLWFVLIVNRRDPITPRRFPRFPPRRPPPHFYPRRPRREWNVPPYDRMHVD